jgi:ankyrin repeat protein
MRGARRSGPTACAVIVVALVASATAGAADMRLVDAAKRNDLQTARALVAAHADLNARQNDGATALHWAAYHDNLELAALLLDAGAPAAVANDLRVTPLFIAATAGSAEMVRRLIAAGAEVNAANATNVTPLMAAARSGSVETVAALLDRGARVDEHETVRDQTALMWAAAEGHPAIVGALVAHGADLRARSRVRPVLVNRGDYNGGRANAIEEVGRGGYSALMFAARSGSGEVVDLLLSAGADVNETAPDGTSVLLMAAHSGHGRLAGALLERGADPNAAERGYTPLHAAILRGDRQLVAALLAKHADPNARITKGTPLRRFGEQQFVLPGTFVGSTPFLLAARYAELEIMRTLVAHGADVSVVMPNGTTALMLAAGVEWEDTGVGGFADRRARFLPAGNSPWGLPDWTHTLPAVELVLSLGADVNARNNDGNTALHGAAKGFDAVIELLVSRGADPNLKNRRSQTPLSIAASRADLSSTAPLLRKLGASQ